VVERVRTHAYYLRFTPSIKKHLIVHVLEIIPASYDPLPRQWHLLPPPMVVDREEELNVREVVDSNRRYRKLLYKMQWVGDQIISWQSAGDLEHTADLLKVFH